MSQIIETRCDFCGAVKRAVNHWWKIGVRGSGQSGNPTLIIVPFEENLGAPVADACGMNCATQALSRFLDHGDLSDKGEK
jgi:hypothetical protein